MVSRRFEYTKAGTLSDKTKYYNWIFGYCFTSHIKFLNIFFNREECYYEMYPVFHNAIESYRSGHNTTLETYVSNKIKWALTDYLRKIYRRKKEYVTNSLEKITFKDFEYVETKIDIEIILSCKLISERDKQAIVLYYLKDYKLKEVGTFLGITEAAASLAVKRTVKKLREYYAH